MWHSIRQTTFLLTFQFLLIIFLVLFCKQKSLGKDETQKRFKVKTSPRLVFRHDGIFFVWQYSWSEYPSDSLVWLTEWNDYKMTTKYMTRRRMIIICSSCYRKPPPPQREVLTNETNPPISQGWIGQNIKLHSLQSSTSEAPHVNPLFLPNP